MNFDECVKEFEEGFRQKTRGNKGREEERRGWMRLHKEIKKLEPGSEEECQNEEREKGSKREEE